MNNILAFSIIILLVVAGFIFQRSSYFKKNTSSMTTFVYKIDEVVKTKDEFENFKKDLYIDTDSEISSNFSYGENEYDGTEVHYNAVNNKTGEKYQYSWYETTGGKLKTYAINKILD